ncbi:1-aminocyclopropane-1-carboxylate oxidase homolog 1-like protein [Tanacetum coccineum]
MDISNSNGDRTKQLKAFDDTKSGVKGLVDAAAGGVVDILQIFIRPPEEVADLELTRTSLRVHAIDLAIDLIGVGDKRSCTRERIVEQVKHASEKWGFFQVLNRGVPMKVLEAMLNGVHEFNE